MEGLLRILKTTGTEENEFYKPDGEVADEKEKETEKEKEKRSSWDWEWRRSSDEEEEEDEETQQQPERRRRRGRKNVAIASKKYRSIQQQKEESCTSEICRLEKN